MKKVLLSGLVGLALFAFSGCTQQVTPEPVKVEVVSSKCDMGKATSTVAKCGSGD